MDAQHLRRALGRFTTGVTIVSCVDADGACVGLTVNSFGSLSLEPPLVHWALRQTSPSLGAFEAAPCFAVNVLAESQVELSRRFAARRDDKFEDGVWAPGPAWRAGAGGLRRGLRVRSRLAAGGRRPSPVHRPRARLQRVGAAAAGVPGRPLPPAGRDAVTPRIEGKWIEMFAEVLSAVRRASRAIPARCCRRRRRGPNCRNSAVLALAAHRRTAFPARVAERDRWRRRCRCARPARRTPIGGLAPVVHALAASVVRRRLHGRRACSTRPSCRRSWPAARACWRSATSTRRSSSAACRAPRTRRQVRDAMRRLKAARAMQVTSAAGTDLRVDLAGARIGGVWGFTARPGTLSHWPGGLVLAFPAAGSRQRHAGARPRRRQPHVQALPAGPGAADDRERPRRSTSKATRVDAEMMRGYFEAWGDPCGLRRLARRLGPEPPRALGRDDLLRQGRLQRHRAACLCRQLPLLAPAPTRSRAATRWATSTCRCAAARCDWTAWRWSKRGGLL